jgi:hypothetical protein
MGCALGLLSCAGTESPIFESTALKTPPETPQQPTVMPPPGAPADAGRLPDDGPRLPVPPLVPEEEDAGIPIVDPGLDPNATFDWTETLPGKGTCKAGRYVGGFECTMPGVTGLPVSISGEIAFNLTGSPEEQSLTVEDGTLSGLFFGAELSGNLDCQQDAFTGLSDGGMLDVGGPGTFTAWLAGAYDDQSLGIEGSFSIVNDQNQTCVGTFGVQIAP